MRGPSSAQPAVLALRLAAGAAAFCVLLALVCVASVAWVANRPSTQTAVFQPIVVHLGNFGLSAAVSGTPDCPPEIQDCSVPPQPDRLYGSVWYWITTRNPTGVTSSFKPLLRFRLR